MSVNQEAKTSCIYSAVETPIVSLRDSEPGELIRITNSSGLGSSPGESSRNSTEITNISSFDTGLTSPAESHSHSQFERDQSCTTDSKPNGPPDSQGANISRPEADSVLPGRSSATLQVVRRILKRSAPSLPLSLSDEDESAQRGEGLRNSKRRRLIGKAKQATPSTGQGLGEPRRETGGKS